MDTRPIQDAEERELARSFLERLPRPRNEECLDALELASYADGLIDEGASERVESHVALCSRCRSALIDARTLPDESAPPEGRFVERARRLVAASPPSRWRRAAGSRTARTG